MKLSVGVSNYIAPIRESELESRLLPPGPLRIELQIRDPIPYSADAVAWEATNSAHRHLYAVIRSGGLVFLAVAIEVDETGAGELWAVYRDYPEKDNAAQPRRLKITGSL